MAGGGDQTSLPSSSKACHRRRQQAQIASWTSVVSLLLYYRTYANHVFIGMLGGIDNSNVGRYFGKIEPLLAKKFRIPKRKIELSEEEILELVIDATEQEIEQRKGTGYSGKKKRQTIKTQIAVTTKGIIKSVSHSVKGSIHDKKLYDQTKMHTIKNIKKRGDLGYIGTSMLLPFKKPKNGELTERQKLFNHQFSKLRILSYRFRNPIRRYNLIIKNIAGLRNFIAA